MTLQAQAEWFKCGISWELCYSSAPSQEDSFPLPLLSCCGFGLKLEKGLSDIHAMYENRKVIAKEYKLTELL